jgi:hypothetical protein
MSPHSRDDFGRSKSEQAIRRVNVFGFRIDLLQRAGEQLWPRCVFEIRHPIQGVIVLKRAKSPRARERERHAAQEQEHKYCRSHHVCSLVV